MKKNFKKIVCALTAAVMVITQPCMTAFAEETEKTEEELAAELAAKKAAAYALPVDTNSLADWPQGPSIYAEAGCVMDMESGAILYGKNIDEQLYPASITKLLTVLVALENAELTDVVTFSQASIDFLEWGDAHIGMKVGEQISLEDALYAILLASANEVSYAVAESTGINRMNGDYSTFIQEMNDRAKEIGCTGSNWVNPNGLHNEEHYTTAHDMALIASEVYKYDVFRTIMETYEYRIGFTNITKEERVFQQNHKMLWEGNSYSWELATGGKTGYTDQAGTTLVTMAEDGNLKLACVVLNDYGADAYVDTRAMMDYVFAGFDKVFLAEEELPEEIESLKNEDACILLPEGIDFSQVDCEIILNDSAQADEQAQAAEGEVVLGVQAGLNFLEGTAVFTYEGQIVGRTEVTVKEESLVEEEPVSSSENITSAVDVKEEVKEGLTMRQKAEITAAITAGVVILVMAYIFDRKYRVYKKRKKQRKKGQKEKKNMKKHQ